MLLHAARHVQDCVGNMCVADGAGAVCGMRLACVCAGLLPMRWYGGWLRLGCGSIAARSVWLVAPFRGS
jgi:hypothetical protein